MLPFNRAFLEVLTNINENSHFRKILLDCTIQSWKSITALFGMKYYIVSYFIVSVIC